VQPRLDLACQLVAQKQGPAARERHFLVERRRPLPQPPLLQCVEEPLSTGMSEQGILRLGGKDADPRKWAFGGTIEKHGVAVGKTRSESP
jgi:hypothetical protein